MKEKKSRIVLRIVDPEELMERHFYCRPLRFQCGDSGGESYTMSTAYGGIVNNFEWILITECFGECWIGKKISEATYLDRWPLEVVEVLEGKIPDSHVITKSNVYPDAQRKWFK